MLDREALQELAQFKLLLRQYTGLSVKIDELMHDPQYQRSVFELADEQDQPDLLMASLLLRSRLGWLEARTTVAPQSTSESAAAPSAGMDPEPVAQAQDVKAMPAPATAEPANFKAAQPASRPWVDRYLKRSREAHEDDGDRYVVSLR